ncbi:hypothetical protein FSP39_023088 [Pinctada imbricata]|uniref:Follistatin n=1 Tax=Pinctada imbricata TaxID=66713 RepID=A0AA88YCK8_PINIB|nr:hypothetical protein FSP39_023088 [Pinctada imbricata]
MCVVRPHKLSPRRHPVGADLGTGRKKEGKGATGGGVCWYSVTKSGLCRRPYKVNVTKIECCDTGVPSMSWTPHDNPSSADLFFWEHLRKGASQCQPCHKTCDAVKCQSNKKCVLRRGRPKCVCKRKCSKRHRRQGILCGNDGRTYKSECHLLRRNCRKDQNVVPSYKGRCRQSCKKVECLDKRRRCLEDQNGLPHCVLCKKACPEGMDNSPLCGEDSITYAGLCHLRQAVCRRGRAIKIAYRGTCRKNATCLNTLCPDKMKCLVNPFNSQPQCEDCQRECSPLSKKFSVCGTDGVTYTSYCELRKTSCRMGISLSTKRAGKCKSSK